MKSLLIRPVDVCVLLGALLALPGVEPAAAEGPVNYADPPTGVFLDEWMTVEMMGSRVGYGHTQMARTGHEIHSTTLMSISLNRLGSPVTIKQLQTAVESVGGDPLEFTSQFDASIKKLTMRGVIRDGKVRVTSQQFGAPTSNVYDFPENAVMTYGTLLKQQQMGLEAGTRYTVDVFEPSIAADIAVRFDVQVHPTERIEIDGRAIEATRTTQTLKLPNSPMEIPSEAWLDKNGTVLRSTLSMAGMPMVMTRASKAKALEEFSPPEFFAPTTIKVNRRVDRSAARRIEYTLKLRDNAQAMPPMPRTGMQRPEATTRDSVKLAVERTDHAGLRSVPARQYGAEYAPYLKPNPIINNDDPAVRKMAEEARASARTPYEIADRLRVYVTDVITNKSLDVGFASASEVCRSREGDCSEHAVLLAAMGRACGIPSRVATGLVYVPVIGADRNVFGFHMWTQFLIGDQWVDFDAAQRESDCNPTHIAFSVTSLHDAGLGQVAFGLISVIGNLDLTIDRIEPASAGGS